MTCRHPDAFYLALDEEHLELLWRGALGGCFDKTHSHRILRLWCLDYDLRESVK